RRGDPVRPRAGDDWPRSVWHGYSRVDRRGADVRGRGEVAGRSPSDVPRGGGSAGAARRSRLFVVRVDGPTGGPAGGPAAGPRPPAPVGPGRGAPGLAR